MSHSAPTIATVFSAPFGQNTFVAHFPDRSDCLVVDPGLEPEKIIHYLEENGLEPAAILCTHGHSDHIAGNAALKERWPNAPLVIGEGDAEKLTDPQKNLSAAFGARLLSPAADKTVREGDQLDLAGFKLDVFDTPGHSRGHIVFVWHSQPTLVFGGDVLFEGSIGRTDFYDGDFATLRRSIHEKLFVLPDDTIVYPGHGMPTTIGVEKHSNPFVGLNA